MRIAAEHADIQLTEQGSESMARLLTRVWGTGAAEGVTAEIRQTAAPGLPVFTLEPD